MPEPVHQPPKRLPLTAKSVAPAPVPATASVSDILQLQRVIGNHAVTALVKRQALPIRRVQAQPIQRVEEAVANWRITTALESMPSEVEAEDFKLNPAIPKRVAALTTEFEKKAGSESEESSRSAKMIDEVAAFAESVVNGWVLQVEKAYGSKDRESALAQIVHSAQRFFEDVSYWDAAIREIIARYEVDNVPNLKTLVPLIEKTMEQEEVAPEKRIKVECTMGQGVVGSLRHYILYSDQFSSCSPVVLYSASKRLGGLFHYAAGGTGQLPQLKAMVGEIGPSWVGITERPDGSKDFQAQREFFTSLGLGAKLHPLVDTGSHLMLMLGSDPNTPVINGQTDNSGYVNLTRTSELPPELKPFGLKLFFSPEHYAISFTK